MALASVLVVIAPACDGTAESPAEIGPTAYVAAIDEFLPPSVEPDSLPVVYLIPVSDDHLPLATQVAVIEGLAQEYDVRFVDHVDAAIDDAALEEPPRDDGTLIGLSRITPEPPHQVRVELYRDRERVSALLLTLGNDEGEWVVTDSEVVAPEVLVGDE